MTVTYISSFTVLEYAAHKMLFTVTQYTNDALQQIIMVAVHHFTSKINHIYLYHQNDSHISQRKKFTLRLPDWYMSFGYI